MDYTNIIIHMSKFEFFTNITRILCPLAVLACSCSSSDPAPEPVVEENDKVLVANLPNDGKTDASEKLQSIINSNPNRTIYIPDGTYLIEHSLTTPAHATRSVALQLAKNAVLVASGNWDSDKPMISLGKTYPTNDVANAGYFFFIDGGTLDCNGVAKGVAIDGGREVAIRNLNILNTVMGINIAHGANSGSADADIKDVTITGNGKAGSTGVRINAYDNSLSRIDISNVQTGLEIVSGGNVMRNINISGCTDTNRFNGTTGIRDMTGDCWYISCSVTDCETAYRLENAQDMRPAIESFTAAWSGKTGKRHIVFDTPGAFNIMATNLVVKMNENNAVEENIITIAQNGNGQIAGLTVDDPAVLTSLNHEKFIVPADGNSAASGPAMEELTGRVVVAEIDGSGKNDVSDQLQTLVNSNPDAIVYLPDGKYLLGKPLVIKGRDKCAALRLANFAVISPTNIFQGEYLIDMDSSNDARGAWLEGGTVDGKGISRGIDIRGGKKNTVANTTVLNTNLSLFVSENSSENIISSVNTTGVYSVQSVGIAVYGSGNSLSNLRLNNIHEGVRIYSSGNVLTNVHPLHYNQEEGYASSCGFIDAIGGNTYDFCYSDQFATGFRISKGKSVLNNCNVFWFAARGNKRVAVKSDSKFDSEIKTMSVNFGHALEMSKVLEAPDEKGDGCFLRLWIKNPQNLTDSTHEQYMK